jgi:hypothetical protein
MSGPVVVVVDEDVDDSDCTAPPAAGAGAGCFGWPAAWGRDDDPDWQAAMAREAATATAAMVARFMSAFLSPFAGNVTRC